MKTLSLALVFLVLGAVLGIGLARNDVGEVADGFYPPGLDEDLVASAGELSDGSAGPSTTPKVGPAAEVDSESYDFGTMQRGATKTHEFVFTNTGTAPLTLEVGRTTCKCTLGEVAKRPLAPGESTPVRLEWVAKNPQGQFRQVATVLTNDPRRSSVELTVEGLITDTVGLQPKEFLLGRVASDSVSTASVFLASYEEGPDAPPLEATVRLEGAEEDDSERYEFAVETVALEDLPIERATSGVKITVKAGPGLPIGSLTKWVKIETNLLQTNPGGEATRGMALQAPLYGIVEGDISLHGAGWSKERGLLNLGKVVAAEGDQAKLRVSFKGDYAADLRAEVASVEPEWLEVELGDPKAIREGVFHQPMTVRIPPGSEPVVRSGPGEDDGGVGKGDALVRLSINHPTTSELDVKVRFVIAD